MTNRYCVFVIPAANQPAANLLMAIVNGDENLILSNSFSRGANADGSYSDPEDPYATATHFFGGMPITEAWETTVSNLSTSLVTPPGGYPYNGISEQDAQDAAEAIHLQITVTQDGSSPDPTATLNNAMSALNLVPIVVEE